MRKISVADWIQLTTGLAVLVGLGLVVWELQQTKNLTRAQLLSEGHIADMTLHSMNLSETFAEVRAKACFHPDELTDSELFEMYAYHSVLVSNVSRMRMLNHAGVFPEEWQDWAREYLKTIMSTKAGQADIETFGLLHPADREMLDELIARKEIGNCADSMRLYFEKARN